MGKPDDRVGAAGARALNAFLRDIYSEQAIVADGVIEVQALDRAPGFRSTGRLCGDAVRAHISGTDLVCDRAGHWMVLEDNLRIPSGTAYAIVNRRLLAKHLPELSPPAEAGDVESVPQLLLDTLRASAPSRVAGEPSVALLSAGWDDSAWFEHTFLADEMGIPLVQIVRPVGAGRKAVAPHRFRDPPDRCAVRPDGRGHAAFVHRLRRRAVAARAARGGDRRRR